MEVKLVYFRSDGQRREVKLRDGITVVGRRDDCNIRIPAETVSRRHCQFEVSEDEVVLTDLGSSNGTFVNGRRIGEDEDVVLKPGDRITIGPATFTVQIDGEPAEIIPPEQDMALQERLADSGAVAASTEQEEEFDPFSILEELEEEEDEEEDFPTGEEPKAKSE